MVRWKTFIKCCLCLKSIFCLSQPTDYVWVHGGKAPSMAEHSSSPYAILGSVQSSLGLGLCCVCCLQQGICGGSGCVMTRDELQQELIIVRLWEERVEAR